MVGLVIVSHSRALAEALVVLVRQVAPKELPLAIAAGVGQGHREFGTDAVEIIEAIKSVYSPDGVLVLMDLGSAVLSAELALDLLPSEMRENIALCPAPLVEGAIAAGVQAGLGSNIKAVFWEAQKALDPKLEHLSGSMKDEVLATAPLLSSTGTEIASTIFLTLQNLHGLHARPAARLVQVATSYNVDITVTNETNGTGPVSAKSLNALVTLGGECGHQIAITARGPNASQALDALKKLVLSNFGESSD